MTKVQRDGFPYKPHIIHRYWSRVSRGPHDTCWPWNAQRNPKGYGVFWDGVTTVPAQRVALQLSGQRWRPGLYVCHSCDNPPCCNPAHLFLGSASANQQDSVRKQRRTHLVGERANRGAVLSENEVISIREARARSVPVRVLAERYGVCEATISHAAVGRNWRHLS